MLICIIATYKKKRFKLELLKQHVWNAKGNIMFVERKYNYLEM